MSFRILLVDPESTTVAATESALVEAGHRVAWVSTFEEATKQLSLGYPDLLITAVRLGAFNGLHLLIRFRAEHPDVPAIVMDAMADLTTDMRDRATRFLAPPIDRASLAGLVSELLAGRTPRDPDSLRRWPRKRAELPAIIHRTSPGSLSSVTVGSAEMTAAPDDVPGRHRSTSIARLEPESCPRWLKPPKKALMVVRMRSTRRFRRRPAVHYIVDSSTDQHRFFSRFPRSLSSLPGAVSILLFASFVGLA